MILALKQTQTLGVNEPLMCAKTCEMNTSCFLGVAAVGNKLLVLSGHDGANSFYHTVEEYNIDRDAWTVLSCTVIPYGRCRFGCVSLTLPERKYSSTS